MRKMIPPPLVVIKEMPQPEFVGDKDQNEVAQIVQEGCPLYLATSLGEYVIEWTNGQFIFTIWTIFGETRDYEQPYSSFDELLQAEGSRESFDLTKFEVIA